MPGKNMIPKLKPLQGMSDNDQIPNITLETDMHQEFIMSTELVMQQMNAKHYNFTNLKLKLDKASAMHI